MGFHLLDYLQFEDLPPPASAPGAGSSSSSPRRCASSADRLAAQPDRDPLTNRSSRGGTRRGGAPGGPNQRPRPGQPHERQAVLDLDALVVEIRHSRGERAPRRPTPTRLGIVGPDPEDELNPSCLGSSARAIAQPRHVEAALCGDRTAPRYSGNSICRRGPDHGAWHQQHAPLASACTRRAGLRPEVAVRAATSHRVMRCSRRRCGAAPAATRPPFRNDSVDRRRTLMSLVADGVSRRPRMLCDPAPTPRARCAILL